MSDQAYAYHEENESQEKIKEEEKEEEEKESEEEQRQKAKEAESEVVVHVSAISTPTVMSRGFSGAPTFKEFRNSVVSTTDTNTAPRASETKEDKDKNKNKSTTKARELGEDYYFKERSYGDEEDDNDNRVYVGEGGDYYEKKKSGLFNIFKKR